MKKSYRGLPIFVWALLALLGLSAAMLSLGQRDDTTDPAADSYGPSGVAALAELLRSRGYAVDIDRWPHPRLSAGDVAIECPVFGPLVNEDSRAELSSYLNSKVDGGADVIELAMPSDFQAVSRHLLGGATQVVPRGGGTPMRLAAGDPSKDFGLLTEDPNDYGVGLWDIGKAPFLRAFQVGQGRILVAANGLFVTNRFIDRDDDAAAALQMVQMLAHPGGHIVFLEAAHGAAVPPSLMESIGPWANASWQQLLFLCLVVVYSLGKRFGIPEETRPPQRGARELVDAIADTYLRGRMTRAAMRSSADRIEISLHSALHLPRDANFDDLAIRLPATLARALKDLRTACGEDPGQRPDEALALVSRARSEVDIFLSAQKSVRAPTSSL